MITMDRGARRPWRRVLYRGHVRLASGTPPASSRARLRNRGGRIGAHERRDSAKRERISARAGAPAADRTCCGAAGPVRAGTR